ncbi:hypothetical protein FAM18132_02606 [Lacticaseibacillus paracasei]|nr:hypothetical protein FAM18101_02776 [Lacticaseibacillus paracasei]RND43351.1 hypothetical protein FAM18105_02140 [Lacticaseibacillus paracasei]RND69204.1 hypothetical protein FAM18132_02606 [Lacticaseibacillus paracasei]
MKKALVGLGIMLGVSTLTACTTKNGESVTSRSGASTQQKESAGLKSIFETDFKRHSEPRLPSTAQINH